MQTTIYKICPCALWTEAQRSGKLPITGDDARDGFIHFSTECQLAGTAEKYFADMPDLMLLAVSVAALGGALKWEVSRGGGLFPHLYGDLPLAAVLWASPLPEEPDRQRLFAELGR